jgi:hypothetical protein
MDAIGKIRSVMEVLRQRGGGEKQLWLRLRDAVRELSGEVRQAHEAEITDIKRRAGIVEFAPDPRFTGGDGGGTDPEGVPLWQRLQSIAQNAQGAGRIDQHQIEEIFRAVQVLKGYDR